MFRWSELMRAGLFGLRLTPEAFWALTPAELRVMLGENRAAVMDRSGFEALMAAYPDGQRGEGDD